MVTSPICGSLRPQSPSRPPRSQRGFTLIEILITVLVLSIGLLGLAGLQATGMRANTGALLRTQATLLAADLGDRIRANPTQAAAGAYAATAAPGVTSCLSGGCGNAGAVTNSDLQEWYDALAVQLPSGTGTVAWQAANNNYLVTVMWDDARTGATGTACGGDPNTDLMCFSMTVTP